MTNNYFYTSSQNGAKPSQALVKPENIAAPSFQNMPSIDAIDYVKHIGKGMRKTLQDLLEVLKKEKEKRHKRKNKSVITILSHIITETKESQTEYRDQDKPSERLNMLQILEVDGSEATNVNKANIEKPVPDKANRVEINAEKAKGEMKGKVTRNAPQKKTNKNRKLVQNVNKTKTAIQSKEEINKKCEEKRKQVNATGQSKLPLENTEETKMVHQSKSDEYEKKTNATMLQLHENTDEAKPTLQSKEAKTIINVEPEINENLKQCGLGNKTQAIIQSKLNINEALKENKKETETAIRSKLNINANHRENTKEIKSITRFKTNMNQSERERKILQTMSDIIEKRNEYKTKIFPHSRSDIIEILQDKFREAKPSIHSQSCTNEKLQGNTMEIKTILPCRSKINESSIKHENIRKDNSIIQSRSNINEESEDSEENDKETAIYQFKSDITEKHEENEKQKSETKQETETVPQTTSDMNEKSPKNRNEQKTIPQSNSRYKQTELETDRKDSAIVTITDDNFNLFDDAENLEFNYNGSKLSRLLMLSNDEKAKGAMGTLSSKAIRTKNDLKSNLSKTNDTAHPESKGCDTTELNENVRRRTFLSFFLRSAKRM